MLTIQETEKELLDGAVVLSMPRDLVITTGDDAASFLNGQLSQTIEPIVVGASRWALLLEPKGKVAAWLRVTRADTQTFWLDTDQGFGETMLTRLNRFTLRTKVDFRLIQAQCYAVRGTRLPERPASTEGQISVDIGWIGAQGFDLVGPSVSKPQGTEGEPTLLHALRIADGVPAMGKEFQRSTIPAETGVVDLSADFSKGCYVGQELIARVNSRGNNTPRKVQRLTIGTGASREAQAAPRSEAPRSEVEAGAAVLVEGIEVGTVTSVAALRGKTIALASIKRGTEPSTSALVEAGDGWLSAVLHAYEPLRSDSADV